MKNFILNECGVSEISRREMVETNGGGIIGGIIKVLICAIITDIILNPSDAAAQFGAGMDRVLELMRL